MEDQRAGREGAPVRRMSDVSVVEMVERLDPESRAAFFRVYDLLVSEGLRAHAAELERSGGRVKGEDVGA